MEGKKLKTKGASKRRINVPGSPQEGQEQNRVTLYLDYPGKVSVHTCYPSLINYGIIFGQIIPIFNLKEILLKTNYLITLIMIKKFFCEKKHMVIRQEKQIKSILIGKEDKSVII